MKSGLIVIGVSGLVCAGKSTLVRFATEEIDAASVSFRTFFAARMEEQGLEETREGLDSFATEYRLGRDPTSIIQEMVEEVDAEVLVVDGIRRPATAAWLRDHAARYWGLFVHAPMRARTSRLAKRGGGELGSDKLAAYDARILADGLGTVLSDHVDEVINNGESIHRFRLLARQHLVGFLGQR